MERRFCLRPRRTSPHLARLQIVRPRTRISLPILALNRRVLPLRRRLPLLSLKLFRRRKLLQRARLSRNHQPPPHRRKHTQEKRRRLSPRLPQRNLEKWWSATAASAARQPNLRQESMRNKRDINRKTRTSCWPRPIQI